MKLCIKQKVFSWVDTFNIMDENGRVKYQAKGELFSWGKKLHICDMNNNELAFIQQKVFSFLPKYYVYINGQEVAQVVKEFTFIKPRYTILGLGWEVNGEFLAHDYQITQGGQSIVSIEKEWFTWGDCYALDIANPADEIVALSAVLVIDCVMAQSSNSPNM